MTSFFFHFSDADVKRRENIIVFSEFFFFLFISVYISSFQPTLFLSFFIRCFLLFSSFSFLFSFFLLHYIPLSSLFLEFYAPFYISSPILSSFHLLFTLLSLVIFSSFVYHFYFLFLLLLHLPRLLRVNPHFDIFTNSSFTE